MVATGLLEVTRVKLCGPTQPVAGNRPAWLVSFPRGESGAAGKVQVPKVCTRAHAAHQGPPQQPLARRCEFVHPPASSPSKPTANQLQRSSQNTATHPRSIPQRPDTGRVSLHSTRCLLSRLSLPSLLLLPSHSTQKGATTRRRLWSCSGQTFHSLLPLLVCCAPPPFHRFRRRSFVPFLRLRPEIELRTNLSVPSPGRLDDLIASATTLFSSSIVDTATRHDRPTTCPTAFGSLRRLDPDPPFVKDPILPKYADSPASQPCQLVTIPSRNILFSHPTERR